MMAESTALPRIDEISENKQIYHKSQIFRGVLCSLAKKSAEKQRAAAGSSMPSDLMKSRRYSGVVGFIPSICISVKKTTKFPRVNV
jgi:hypothetical protein